MNAFKKVFNELMQRIHFDVKAKDMGVDLKVRFNPNSPKGELKKTASFAVIGADNPIGGILICCLRNETDDPIGTHIVPAISNMANRFVFLNGMFLPDSGPREITLAKMMMIDQLDVMNNCGGIHPLGDGYVLEAAYISPKALCHIYKDGGRGTGNWAALRRKVIKTVLDLLPDMEHSHIVSTGWSDIGKGDEDLNLAADQYLYDEVAGAKFVDTGGMDKKKDSLAPLVVYLAEYYYSNILKNIGAAVRNMVNDPTIPEIPIDMSADAEAEWIKKHWRKIKDKEIRDKVFDAIVNPFANPLASEKSKTAD